MGFTHRPSTYLKKVSYIRHIVVARPLMMLIMSATLSSWCFFFFLAICLSLNNTPFLVGHSSYEVKPLSRGKYKGVSFEDGGGFKVNFGGDGILQYHPEKGSHHGGAYYKISTGKGGTKHYELDGSEKDD